MRVSEDTTGGFTVPGVPLGEFLRLATEPEATREGGLAASTPLEWHWRCRDCGHTCWSAWPRVTDSRNYCGVGLGDDECDCHCEFGILELRPRRPRSGSVLRRLFPETEHIEH